MMTAIKSNLDYHAQEIYSLFMKRHPGPVNPSMRDKSITDLKLHLLYFASAIEINSPTLWKSYLEWNYGLFRHLGLEPSWDAVVVCMHDYLKQVAGKEISADLQHLLGVYLNLQKKIVREPLSGPAQDYLTWLLKGNKPAIIDFVTSQIKTQDQVKAFYLSTVQPAMVEIGHLWHERKITVAQEHYATALSQIAISQLYPVIFNKLGSGYKAVSACIGNELHEIGIRMVSDFLEMDGWQTIYLGANVPNQALQKTVIEEEADLVMLSCTMGLSLPTMKTAITHLRESSPQVKIAVGGAPFILDANLSTYVGADAMSLNATDAVHLANSLIRGTP